MAHLAPEMLLRGVAAARPEELFAWAADLLAAELDPRCVLIGELVGEEWDRVRTVVLRLRGEGESEHTYDLGGTPCEHVVNQKPCCHPRGVADLFPEDAFLREEGIESYVGTPLEDADGRTLGLIALLDDRPLEAHHAERSQTLLELLGPRIAEALERRRQLEQAALLVRVGSSRSRTAVLRELVGQLVDALHVRFGWLGTHRVGDEEILETRAWAHRAGWAAPRTVSAPEAVPAGVCDHGERRLIPDRLQERHPGLQWQDAVALIAVPLAPPDGPSRACLVLGNDRPLNPSLGSRHLVDGVAERLERELALIALEERERALERVLHEQRRFESLGILAGGIAHDFNNLLVGLLGGSDLALRLLEESHPAHASVARVHEAAQTATELCSKLLDYAGNPAGEEEVADLGEVLREVSSLLRTNSGRAGLLRIHASPVPIPVRVGRDKLPQIILNLVENAAEAMRGREGQIAITTELRHVGADDPVHTQAALPFPAGTYGVLTVTDEGGGMTAETASRAFEPFFSTGEKGRGLGLAAVAGILRMVKGGVRLSSRPGRGTEIEVFLPHATEASTAAPTPARADAPSSAAAAPGTVLLVDDDLIVREVAEAILQEGGYVVRSFPSGEALVDHLRGTGDRDACCLVVDYAMPGMNGLETLRAARLLLPALGAVLVTGHADANLVAAVADEGGARVLAKPYGLEELLTEVGAASRAANT